MRPYARRALVIVLASVVVAVIGAALTGGSLPGSAAVLWSFSGRPLGHLARWPAVVVAVALPLIFGAVTTTFARLRLVPLMCAGFASAGVLVTVLTALRGVFVLSVNVAYGGAAHLPVAVLVLAAAAEVAIGLRAALYIARAPTGEPEEALPAQPARDRAPLWRGVASARRPIVNSIVFFGIGFAALLVSNDPLGGLTLGAGMIVAAIFILALTAIVVEIDDREFRVHYFGGARWPATHLAIPAIREVAVVNVDPPGSGGWGYRGNLRRRGAAAVNIRRGPGLRLTLDGGRRFLVTVSDPEGGARVLGQFVTAH